MEARHLGTWDEYTPAGLVVAKDATFAHDSNEVDDDILMEGDDHVLMLPKGERLNACQVMAGDGLGLGVTVVPLPRARMIRGDPCLYFERSGDG